MTEVKVNELIDIGKIKPEEFFTATGFEITLARITAEVKTVTVDIKTDRGRKDLASLAHKIARSKTAIDELGKDFVSVLKERSKKVDEARKTIRDQLDSLKEEIRKPLTDFEEAEKKRLAAQRQWINSVNGLIGCTYNHSKELSERIKWLEELFPEELDETTIDEFKQVKETVIVKLNERLVELIQKEENESEIRRLKAERAESDRIERENKIAENAAKKAKEESERIAREQIAKAEREKIEAEVKLAEAEKQKQREIQAIKDKQIAEENRIKKEQEEKDRIEKARAENVKHQARVNTEAKEALMKSCGIGEITAKLVLISIIKNEIPNVHIKY